MMDKLVKMQMIANQKFVLGIILMHGVWLDLVGKNFVAKLRRVNTAARTIQAEQQVMVSPV